MCCLGLHHFMLHAACCMRASFTFVVVQGSWNALVEAGNASQTLQSKTDYFTVFAPVTTAVQAAIAKSAVTCQRNFYLDQQCTTLMQLLKSTSLPQLLQNHSKFSCSDALLSITVFNALHSALQSDIRCHAPMSQIFQGVFQSDPRLIILS